MGVADLGDDITERRLVKLEPRNGLVERCVNFLFLAARVCQIDRLVLLAKSRDLLPSLGAGVDDRRLVGVRDAADVRQVEHIHEAALLIAKNTGVFGVVVEDPGHERGRPADDPGRHGYGVIGVEWRRLLGDHLGDVALRLHKRACRPLIADPNALLDECVVSLGELLDLLFASLQLARQPCPLATDGGPPFVGEVALHLLP